MPTALYFTTDQKACELLAADPFALLVGFAIDQQVSVQKAFEGPYVLKKRMGTLDPKKLAKLDLEDAFREKPAIHRFPSAMAKRVQELAVVVTEDFAGDASKIWTEAKDTADLKARLESLPGFGEMKVRTISVVLAKQFGVKAAEPLAPNHMSLGDVTSPEFLLEYQAKKAEKKAAMRAAAKN